MDVIDLAVVLAGDGTIIHDLLITPVARQLHIGRSTIVSRATRVGLELTSELPALVSIDGVDTRLLHPHDRIEVRRSEVAARFARFGPRSYFFAALSDQLRWS